MLLLASEQIIFGNLSAVPNSTPDSYQTVLTRISDKLQLDLSDTLIFVKGMTTVLRKYANMRFENFLPPQEDLQTIFTDYNNVLKKLAQNFKHFYVDIPSQCPGNVEESWKFYADGIHPNNAGYDFMTKILYDSLRSTVVHPRQKYGTRNSAIL